MKILFDGVRVFLPTAVLKNILSNNSEKHLPCLVRMLDVKKPSLSTETGISGLVKF